MLFLSLLLLAATAHAGDDSIFDQGQIGAPTTGVLGYKKIPADDAINQWSIDLDTGIVGANGGASGAGGWQNVYLAFAIDVRYARDCFGTKTTVLCTLLHSGVQINGNLSWNAPVSAANAADRYSVVLIPIEYITGTFAKQGLDLKTTNSALYATIGVRAEDTHDLGLAVENRVTAVLSAGLNYASTEQGLGPSAAFHWIGSVRIFGGGVGAQMGLGSGGPVQGGVTGGIETQIGLALDLAQGSIAFTNTTRLEGDVGFHGYSAGLSNDAIEVKYLHSVCRDLKSGGCNAPRPFSYGGGVRYEYETSSYNTGLGSQNQSVSRLIFFAELARF